MAQNETWLNHDLLDAVKVQYLDGNLFSMDNAGNMIGVKLTRDGVDYSGGGSVSANVIRADGGTVAVVGALSGNTATVVLPQAAYAVPGVVSIIVKLTVSGEVTTIAAVVANVYQSSTDSVIDPGTIIPSVQNLISAIQAAVASIPADYSSLWTSLAPAFSTSTNYTAGQYVTYNGAVDKFIVDHPAGAWNSAHVVATNLGSELYSLKSATDQTGTRMEWTSGGFIVASTGLVGESTNAYSYSDFIPIEAEYLYLHTHMVGAGGVAFYDVNRDYISGFSVENNPSPYVFDGAIPVPQTAKYFRATTRGYTQEAFYLAGGVADIMDFKRLQAVVASMGEFPITWQDNAYVYGAGNSRGYTNSDSNYAVTNYIPVKPGMKIHVKTWLTGQAGICFFTSEAPAASVSGIINEDYTSPYLYEETIEVPSSANFMRVSCRRKKNEAEITLDVIQTIMNINTASVDWTYAGLDRVNATGQFEAQMNSYLAYKNTKFLDDNGTRFYLVPKAKVTSGTGGCLKIFADNYPSQGDYRDLGIYFSANQNGDTGYYGNGVDWINVKVYDDGEYKNKHPDLGFSFQDGAVVAGKVICFDGQRPYWVFGASTPTLNTYCCAEFSSNIGIVANGGGILMRSPNGTLYKVGVANDGTLTVNPVN